MARAKRAKKTFTDRTVKQAKAADKRREIPDRGCAGLYLVVQPTGKKSWALRYRTGGKPAKLTLGPLASEPDAAEPVLGHALTLSEARATATKALNQIKRGIDLAAVRKEEKTRAREQHSDTVDKAMIEFMLRYKGRKRQGIRESTQYLTGHHLGLKLEGDAWKPTGRGILKHWSGRPLASITKREAIALLEKMADSTEKGVTANRALTVLKTFFGWCVKRDMLAISPVAAIDAPSTEETRERILTDAEIKTLWAAADAVGYPYGRLIQLLLLTGARRDELRQATWSEFDLESKTWTLPGARVKNGRDHLVPLSPLAIDILRSLPRIGQGRLLFTLNGRVPYNHLDMPEAMKLAEHWTPHDLRRTFATGLQALEVPVEVIEEALNHKSGTRSGVAGIYARHRYVAERTQALEAWAEHIDTLVKGEQSNG
jgi:integrase